MVAPSRQKEVRHYIDHVDFTVKHSISDTEDQTTALRQDRQGLGLSRSDKLKENLTR